MQTKLSTKGQVVLPLAIRQKLGLRPGDSLEADVRDGIVTLTPGTVRRRKSRVVIDSITGLPVLESGRNGAPLTGKSVRAILDEMP